MWADATASGYNYLVKNKPFGGFQMPQINSPTKLREIN